MSIQSHSWNIIPREGLPRDSRFPTGIVTPPVAPPPDDLSVLRAFPGAEGWGAESLGGRGGQVIKVTNLNDSGPGSLRAACAASGPRVVVFEVAGTIVLNSVIKILNSNITIAGQTAPGGGIQIANKEPGTVPLITQGTGGDEKDVGPTITEVRGTSSQSDAALIRVQASNVVIRYIKIRAGYIGRCPSCPGTGWVNPFDIILNTDNRDNVENVIIDHVTVMWGSNLVMGINDRGGANFRRLQNITVQNCLLAAPLYGRPFMTIGSTKTLLDESGEEMTEIDLHRNLFCMGSSRVFLITGTGVNGDLRCGNNIHYMTRGPMQSTNENLEYPLRMDFRNSIFDHAKDTGFHQSGSRGCYPIRNTIQQEAGVPPPTYYVAGNWSDTHEYDNYNMMALTTSGGGADCARPVAPDNYRRFEPLPAPAIPVNLVPVDDLEDHILPNVGASYRLDPVNGGWIYNRDSADDRVVEKWYKQRDPDMWPYPVRYGTAASYRGIWHEDQMGGFPSIDSGSPYTYDADGISSHWKSRNGVSGNIGHQTVPGLPGWTYLDLFLAGMDLP